MKKPIGTLALRVIDSGPDTVNNGIIARSQLIGRDNFRGKIAVSPEEAEAMTCAEIYAAAVHELGHMLGLKHNASSRSIMYFLNVNGTEVLDRKDILDLSSRHRLRATVASAGFPMIQIVGIAEPIAGGR